MVAGVSRQTISGVESGRYAPSATIALRLAKVLGCRVEELFWLESDLPNIEAVSVKTVSYGQRLPLSLARVGGQWLAYPLVGQDAFRMEMIPTDGEGERQINTDRLQVKLLESPEKLRHTVVLAGCTPAMSLWARATERWHPETRVHWSFANSMAALESLCRGEIHVAGMHLYSPQTGEYNTPFVRCAPANRATVLFNLFNLGVWEEGLLIQLGNPKGLKTVTDLAQPEVTIVNRETGAGCRQLLERLLQESGVPFEAVNGFNQIVRSHLEVAQAVASRSADAGISTASMAAAFGLGFIPLHQSRYDLVVIKDYLEEPPVQQLLSTLEHRWIHSQLKVLGGYDTSQTGDIVATISASTDQGEG